MAWRRPGRPPHRGSRAHAAGPDALDLRRSRTEADGPQPEPAGRGHALRRLRAQDRRRCARSPDVETARVNLDQRGFRSPGDRARPRDRNALAALVEALGYKTVPFAPERLESGADAAQKTSCCAPWPSPASPPPTSCCCRFRSGPDTSTATWVRRPAPAALVFRPDRLAGHRLCRHAVLPQSALARLARGRLNMDVPISLAVLLAAGMSLFETIQRRPAHLFRRRGDAAVLPADRPLPGPPRARQGALRRRAPAGPGRGDRDRRRGRTAARRCLPDQVRNPACACWSRPASALRSTGSWAGSSDLDNSLITGETVPGGCRPGRPGLRRHHEPDRSAEVAVRGHRRAIRCWPRSCA